MLANAPTISQGYKPEVERHIFNNPSGFRNVEVHEGIDIIANAGFPVLATADGIVSDAYYEPLYGNRVVLDHGENENGKFMESRYFHLQQRLVKEGDVIKRGQQIATLGRTGILSGGFPHLHFEVRARTKQSQRLSKPMNPHLFWSDGVGAVTCYDITKEYSEYLFRTTYPVPCLGVDWKQYEEQAIRLKTNPI